MTHTSPNIQLALGLSVPQLPAAVNSKSAFANAVFRAVIDPAESTFAEVKRINGRANVQAWQVNNRFGSAIVVPDRLGPSRDIFRQLPQRPPVNELRKRMDEFLVRLLWFDRKSWDDLAKGSYDVAGAYSTVHFMRSVKSIVPPLYTHVIQNPAAMNMFADTAPEGCDDLEAELRQYDVSSVVGPTGPLAKIVRPDDGGPTQVKITEGESLGMPLAMLGDAHVDFRYVKRTATQYGTHRKEMREELNIIRSAQYLQQQLTWKRAFTLFCIQGEEFLFLSVPKDGDIASAHGAMRHGLRVLLGEERVDEMLKYQGVYGDIEYGIQDGSGKLVVILNTLCGTRIYEGHLPDRLLNDAAEARRVFEGLSTPELPVEVVYSRDREKHQSYGRC